MSHVTRKTSATRINTRHLSAMCIENPRVSGSIPLQATTLKRQTATGWAFLFV